MKSCIFKTKLQIKIEIELLFTKMNSHDAVQKLSPEESQHFKTLIHSLCGEIQNQVFGKREKIELAMLAAIAEGHLLIEDVPGVGKTTLAEPSLQFWEETFKEFNALLIYCLVT